MSDYLTNLSTRIGDPAAVLRPRVPSLFEPVARFPGLFAGETDARAAKLPGEQGAAPDGDPDPAAFQTSDAGAPWVGATSGELPVPTTGVASGPDDVAGRPRAVPMPAVCEPASMVPASQARTVVPATPAASPPASPATDRAVPAPVRPLTTRLERGEPRAARRPRGQASADATTAEPGRATIPRGGRDAPDAALQSPVRMRRRTTAATDQPAGARSDLVPRPARPLPAEEPGQPGNRGDGCVAPDAPLPPGEAPVRADSVRQVRTAPGAARLLSTGGPGEPGNRGDARVAGPAVLPLAEEPGRAMPEEPRVRSGRSAAGGSPVAPDEPPGRPVGPLTVPVAAVPITGAVARPRPPDGGPPRAAAPSRLEPVVHVTIGRIEVRAVPEGTHTASAERPSQRRQPPRVMSLDDYVRQRTAERGR
jgi:hypothetical protein